MAKRCRRMVSGGFQVEEAVKNGSVKLLIVAVDAKENTKIKYTDIAEKNRIPCHSALTKESLGKCLGKEYCAVVAVLDDGFAKSLKKLLQV